MGIPFSWSCNDRGFLQLSLNPLTFFSVICHSAALLSAFVVDCCSFIADLRPSSQLCFFFFFQAQLIIFSAAGLAL